MARLTTVRSKRTKRTIWKIKPFTLCVVYIGGPDHDLDVLIGMTATRPPRRRKYGRQDTGSGYWLTTGERDLSFDFATRRGAEGARARVKALRPRIRGLKTKIIET